MQASDATPHYQEYLVLVHDRELVERHGTFFSLKSFKRKWVLEHSAFTLIRFGQLKCRTL